MNRRKFLLASVLAIQNSSFIYPSCQNCFCRVILNSKRSRCPKCGSTGKVENANYRYKLSLKVAESNKLFHVTVFGSCLDAFFGLTAAGLHRYIEHPNEISETLDSDSSRNLLTKAVETCFVGQSFIFGVTNFENQGSCSNNFLQQCPDRKREVKALVASQILLPDPHVAGFTVIDYFHQFLQPSSLMKLLSDTQASSYGLGLGHSDSDLSSIYGSDSSSYSFKSHGRENFSRFWQSSLELTSSVSELIGNDDLSASEQNKAIGALQNRICISFGEVTGSNSYCDPIQSPCNFVLYMDRESKAEKLGEEHGLLSNQLSAVCSNHEIGVTDSELFPLKIQELLESSNAKSFHSAVEIKTRYSQPEVTCHQHHDADAPSSHQENTAGSPSSLRLEEIASGSRDCDPEMWDDLPFSESLNKFLAAVESETAIIETDASSRKYYLDNDTDKLLADHKFFVTPQRTTGPLCTPTVALKSSQATLKSNSSKDNFLSKCETNESPDAQIGSQLANIAETVSVSANRKEVSDYVLPNAYHSALFSSSEDIETTVTLKRTARFQPHMAKILPRPNVWESDHSFLNIKYTNIEKSLSEKSKKLTTLCSRKCNGVSDLCSSKKKRYSKWTENPDDSFTVCRQLTYPLEPFCSSPNTLKEMPHGLISNLTQRYSAGHEGSYNASADLFDVSAKEMDIVTEMTKKPQDILFQREKSLAESYPSESDFSLKSLSENSSQSSHKLALQSTSACLDPRACSSPPHFHSDTEYDFEDNKDFLPYWQSTPVARFRETRIRGMKGDFENLPAFYSDLDANSKNTRISSEIGTQQATPDGSQNKKINIQRSKSCIISDVTQTVVCNHCPIVECLETDSDEWVPPTPKNEFFSDSLQFQSVDLRRKYLTACNSSNEKELPRKKLKHGKQRMDKCLIKKDLNVKTKLTAIVRKQKTAICNYKHSGWISRRSVIGLGSCSKVKCCLPFSENWSSSVPETNCAWSPELFS